jgi:Tol biopolymer transport system component
LRTGAIERLTTSLANDYMPAYSTDGREIYFASDRRRGYRFTAIFKMPIAP